MLLVFWNTLTLASAGVLGFKRGDGRWELEAGS